MSKTEIDIKKANPPAAEKGAGMLSNFRDEFDELFDRFSRSLAPWSFPMFASVKPTVRGASLMTPSVDVAEDEKGYTITAELPGLAPEDVSVTLRNGAILVSGEKQCETKRDEKNYYVSERSYGAFERRFTLPEDVDADRIKAEVAKGILTVTLPKTEAAKSQAKKIEVKAA